MKLPPLPNPIAWKQISALGSGVFSEHQMREYAAAAVEAYKEDAERYRWLKERGGDGPLMKMACAYSHSSKTNFSTPLAVLNAMTADDAIDAARRKA